MRRFSKPTSKEIWDSYEDKDSYEWKTSGVHTYNVLLAEENKEEKERKKRKVESNKFNQNKKFKDWLSK